MQWHALEWGQHASLPSDGWLPRSSGERSIFQSAGGVGLCMVRACGRDARAARPALLRKLVRGKFHIMQSVTDEFGVAFGAMALVFSAASLATCCMCLGPRAIVLESGIDDGGRLSQRLMLPEPCLGTYLRRIWRDPLLPQSFSWN